MKRLAVLGHPVSHPARRRCRPRRRGADRGRMEHEALDLSPEELATQTKALPEQGFVGANVTIPHKQAALALADEASDAARRIGAANTLSFGTGVIRADNTDATGLLAALPSRSRDARRSSWGQAGRDAPRSGRWPSRAPRSRSGTARRRGRRSWSAISPAPGRRPFGRAPYSSKWRAGARKRLRADHQLHGDRDARDEDPFEHLPLDPERWNAEIVLVDLVYSGSESRLIAEARRRSATAIGGLEVLVRQGGESLRIWTGMDPPLEVMREAAKRAGES